MSQSVALQHRDSIIAKVAEGVPLAIIAKGLHVTPGAISQYLSKDPQYRIARESGAEVRLEEQYEKLTDECADALKLARAREGFKAAAWFAEREFPARWGSKPQESGAQITVVIASRDAVCNAHVVDATPLLTPQDHSDSI